MPRNGPRYIIRVSPDRDLPGWSARLVEPADGGRAGEGATPGEAVDALLGPLSERGVVSVILDGAERG